MKKRIFLVVVDSMGIGAMPDAPRFGDEGSNTLLSASKAKGFAMPTLQRLGLFNIEGAQGQAPVAKPQGAFARMAETSNGKDTTVGHWEIAGVISPQPFPTYPNGFPAEVIDAFEQAIGRKVLCNKPYSGTKVIADYGKEHIATGYPIVYTSADSVFQIAAHEDVIATDKLYEMCRKARAILQGKHGVGRVIARPFAGEWPYVRTSARRDYSLVPPPTMLNVLQQAGLATISVGKIVDIFAESGIDTAYRTHNNDEGLNQLLALQEQDFAGLCFVNLVDTDMVYGHRRDVQGYGDALCRIDKALGDFAEAMRSEDLLIVTADHGCDPAYTGTDHTREYVPMVAYAKDITPVALGTLTTFADISATILHNFGLTPIAGRSFLTSIGLDD